MQSARWSAPPSLLWLASLAALVAALANGLGVVALQATPSCYRLDTLAAWLDELMRAKTATAVGSWAFTIGTVALVPLGSALLRLIPSMWSRTGAVLMAAGGLLNASATLYPVAVAYGLLPACTAAGLECRAAALSLLAAALVQDALFNAVFGAGLIAMGIGLWGAQERFLGASGLVAGLATASVAAQAQLPEAASWLAVAGPLWLLWLLSVAVVYGGRAVRQRTRAPQTG